MVSSGSAGLIYNLSGFRIVLSCATMRELMRWMDRENGMDRGWICGWEETGWIGDNWALFLIEERTKENRLSTRKEERDSSFSLLMDR